MKDLSLHLIDILQNSTRAEATEVYVGLIYNETDKTLTLSIKDNGKGMSAEMVKNVTDPFCTSRTTRKVGLGIPLLKQNAEKTEGSFQIKSELNQGTTVSAVFKYEHVDMLPLGDIGGAMALTISSWEKTEFEFDYKKGDNEFNLKTQDMKEVLEGVPLSNPQVINYIKEIINENIK
ncbi:MAG TPA: ATP-binding protein [Bacteroidales bacterium]|jgi:hypothetical protein|nr:ATP-binding protein [Bacteroidales bacterium]HPX59433.1 ATP-binding protein [Bacteroidales bacterium]HQB19341.1 ATP-binding protein [Bacteroidales bacterium]